jgi:hypothetical protein
MKNQSPVITVQLWHQRRQWRLAGIIATAGLLASLGVTWFLLNPGKAAPPRAGFSKYWIAGVAASLLLAMLVRIFQKREPEKTARELDAKWSSKNRLETASALSTSASPIAEAQRQETEKYLGNQPAAAHRPFPILPILFALAVLLHAFTFVYWAVEKRPRPVAAKEPEKAKPAIPLAKIKWQKPESEMKATKIEEVPLAAVAESDSGLDGMTLEISVNGEPKKSVKLGSEPFDKRGSHPVSVSVYLDELGVEPYDVVSYNLRAQRKYATPLPATVSPLQFIQIRPFRDDATEQKSGGQGSGDAQALLTKLKIAQLVAMKENFVLSNTDLPATDPSRNAENMRVGNDQHTIFTKTGELVNKATEEGWPTTMVDLLMQAQPQMESASKLILATKNNEASPPQGKSLALITEIEKYMRKVLAQQKGKGQGKPPVADPFKDKQQFKLKPREQTDAGQLEQLAQQQAKLVDDLLNTKMPDGNLPAEKQGDNGDAKKPGDAPKGAPKPAAKGDQGGKKPGDEKGQQGSSPAEGSGEQAGEKPGEQSQGGKKPGDGKGQQDSSPGEGSGEQPGEGQGSAPGKDGQGGQGGKGGQGGGGSLAERQDEISRKLGQLMNQSALADSVKPSLAAARDAAQKASEQLHADDKAAAAEPATRASQELKNALTAMEKQSREDAAAALAQAQRDFNDAAEKQKTEDAAAAKENANAMAQTQKNLEDRAAEQQQAGSEAAAKALADLRNQLAASKLAEDLKKLGQNPGDAGAGKNAQEKLAALAQAAAAGRGKMEGGEGVLAQAQRDLERARVNLKRIGEVKDGAGPGKTLVHELVGDIVGAAQQTDAALVMMPDVHQIAAEAIAAARESQPKLLDKKSGAMARLDASLDKLLQLIGTAMAEGKRQEVLTLANPDDAPEPYRKPVADYFEELSRDYAKPTATPQPDAGEQK